MFTYCKVNKMCELSEKEKEELSQYMLSIRT